MEKLPIAMVTLDTSGYVDQGIYGELPTSPCIFAACDEKYFMKHASCLIYSASQAGKSVHIHVINPTLQVFALAGVLNSLFFNNCSSENCIKATFTFNDAKMPEDKEQRKTIYSCLRFLILPELLKSAKKMLCLDIDSIIMKPFNFPKKPIGYFPRGAKPWKKVPTYQKVAAGAVYFTEKQIEYANELKNAIKDVPLKWYADQIALNSVIENIPKKLLATFDKKFMDWYFKNDTIIWTGKGYRKHDDKIYTSKAEEINSIISSKLKKCKNVVLKPRLDIGFKKGVVVRGSVDEPIREHWANFVDKMFGTLDKPLVIEMPRWMFNNKLLSYFPKSTSMFVPHEERQSWGGNKNTKYYMQTVFPWLFTIDSKGWGGGAEFINTYSDTESADSSFFKELSKHAKKGGTKFRELQPQRGLKKDNLLQDDFIFVPLQVPHDTVIKYHSKITCEEFVTKLCQWAGQKGNSKIVFKGHPANIKSMSPLIKIIKQHKNVKYIDDCHVHDMIEASKAVYVINSGVGQEAMLFDKTVVVFGECEYMDAVIKGNINKLDETWGVVNSVDKREQYDRYRRWYNWYSKNVFDTRIPNKPLVIITKPRHDGDKGYMMNNRICAAFSEGCGGKTVYPEEAGSNIATYGILRGTEDVIKQAENFWYIDHGYIKRSNPAGTLNGYFRITKNALWHSGKGNYPTDRLNNIVPHIKKRTGGKNIILAPPSKYMRAFLGLHDWEEKTIEEIKKYSDRPILISTKQQNPMNEVMKDAWAVVTDHSNSAIDALIQGVPIIMTNPARTYGKIENIESLDFDPIPLLSALSYNQWTLDEMRSGKAWRELK